MANLTAAQQSPRIVNGVLHWYESDTFDIGLDLNLRDQDDAYVVIEPEDTVRVVFWDSYMNVVKEFTFTGVADNFVTLTFDSTVTALFPKGRYTYDVYYNNYDGDRKTVMNDNKVVVE